MAVDAVDGCHNLRDPAIPDRRKWKILGESEREKERDRESKIPSVVNKRDGAAYKLKDRAVV